MGSVQVVVGVPTIVSLSASAGMLLANTDSKNAVWINSDASVSPGNGTKVGPLGSVEWTTPNVAIYAALDTGVSTPVTLTTSTNVSNVDDPVAVGSAVAAQLLATGVPSVLTGQALDATPAFNMNGMDVSTFASVTVSLTFIQGGGVLAYGYYDPSTGARISGRQFVITDAGPFAFTAPVKMPNFYMSVTGGVQFHNQVLYGSNRALPETVLGIAPGLQVASTQAYTSGTSFLFNTQTFNTNGGPHQIRFVTTGSAAGLLQFPIYDISTGTIVYLTVADTKEGHISPGGSTITELHSQIYLPPGMLKVQFLPYTTATFQFICQLVPLS